MRKNKALTAHGSTLAPQNDRSGIVFLFVLGLLFTAAGSFGCYKSFIDPYMKVVAARDWLQAPAMVITSHLKVHKGDDNDTYSIHIFYSYVFNGQSYQSNRYSFEKGSDNIAVKLKENILAQYPSGHKFTCYVNPDNPLESVIDRETTGMMFFTLFFLMLFVFIGLGAMVASVVWYYRNKRRRPFKQDTVTGENLTNSNIEPDLLNGKTELKNLVARRATFLGMLMTTLFWNGGTSVFVIIAVWNWIEGDPPTFLTVFIIPFVIIGLWMIYKTCLLAMALFNPRSALSVHPGFVQLGDKMTVYVSLFGNVQRIRKLTIKLNLTEEATYSVGTSTKTDKHALFEQLVYETQRPAKEEIILDQLVIPGDLMHTFHGRYNKILWKLCVEGEIPHWPDMKEEFEVPVFGTDV